MRKSIGFASIILVIAFACTALAQDSSESPEDTAANLKQQLSEIEYKETQFRMRLIEIEEDLKPENIERVFSGIGSTKPEELRDRRRKLLTIERDGLRAQLALLEDKRLRTECAIAPAETAAYWKSAQSLSSPSPLSQPREPSLQMMLTPNAKTAHLLFRIAFVALMIILSCAVVLIEWRRRLSILEMRNHDPTSRDEEPQHACPGVNALTRPIDQRKLSCQGSRSQFRGE